MTPPTEPHDRLTEIKAIHRDYCNFYQLLRGVVLVAVLAGIGVLIFSSDLPSYWQNIYVTIVGAIGTVLIIDQRAEQRAIRQRKQELIAQLGSASYDFAIEAVRLLRMEGWLRDGSMRGASLMGVNLPQANFAFTDFVGAQFFQTNLQKADIKHSNLQGIQFHGSNLQEVNFSLSNLTNAELGGVYLEQSILFRADCTQTRLSAAHLQNSDMKYANLKNAQLLHANIEGADMRDANLEGANLWRIICNNYTVLPDNSYWTPDTDLSRFTDPNHPQFWRSTDPASPAYRPPPKAST